jgi:hypothetical protein
LTRRPAEGEERLREAGIGIVEPPAGLLDPCLHAASSWFAKEVSGGLLANKPLAADPTLPAGLDAEIGTVQEQDAVVVDPRPS